LVRRLERERIDVLAQMPDVVDAVIARRVDFIEFLIRATDFFREDARDRRFPEPAASRKKIRVPYFLRFDLFGERRGDGLLSRDILERLRPVRAVEGLMRHRRIIADSRRRRARARPQTRSP